MPRPAEAPKELHLDIRPLSSVAELAACEEVERRVWGLPDRELMPAAHMVAAVHAGGFAAGAYDGDHLAGFAFGFLARHPADRHAPPGLHSHLLAVLPRYRGAGLGRRLKWFQRRWCLERGLPWITWTFDPLQAKNARLNLEHLGADARSYRRDEYGSLGGELGLGLPSDRLLATWDLSAAAVAGLAAGDGRAPLDGAALSHALRAGPDGLPLALDTGPDAQLLVEIPADVNALVRSAPEAALAWRLALRSVLERLFAKGYRATRFLNDCYLLERS